MTQVELLIQGNFLNLIKAELYLTAGYSLTGFGANFYVIVTVDLGGLNKVSLKRTAHKRQEFSVKQDKQL